MTSGKILSAISFLPVIFLFATARADEPPDTPEAEYAREQAIQEFTKKQRDANWPALFDKVGKEFGVPGDILAGISFAETRWEHLTWPEGESSEPMGRGMPPPYGIMSLWDNEYFGHSLIDAAQLIGKTPEELKSDPLQNIRGAAALLKKIYSENPLPDGTHHDELESWFNAIVKYCGIPEDDLSHRHALDVYDYLQEGYDQYGMELEPHRNLKLEPMRAAVRKIAEEERRKQIAAMSPCILTDEANAPRPSAACPAIPHPGKFRTPIDEKLQQIKNRMAAERGMPTTLEIQSGARGWTACLCILALSATTFLLLNRRK